MANRQKRVPKTKLANKVIFIQNGQKLRFEKVIKGMGCRFASDAFEVMLQHEEQSHGLSSGKEQASGASL